MVSDELPIVNEWKETGDDMGKVALIVQFEIKPGKRDAFLAHIRPHAANTLAEVEGCERFDVLVPKEAQFDVPDRVADIDHVFLYEVYRDESALQAHLESSRVAGTRKGYADLIESRKIIRCAVN